MSGFQGAEPHEYVEAKSSSHRLAWMVSYADIMTIVLTFFVLILSMAQVSSTKFDALSSAFTGERRGNLPEVQEEVDSVVRELGLEEYVRTEIDDNGLSVSLANSVLFASGQAELTPEASRLLDPVGEKLAEHLDERYGLVVEGYTDDVPIRTGRFRSNWELSTSRAIYVMERLVEAGLDQQRISVQGFADTRSHDTWSPEHHVADRETREARAADRKVVLRVVEVIFEEEDNVDS